MIVPLALSQRIAMLFLASSLLLPPAHLAAQTVASPAERLKAVAEQTALDSEGFTPWHMKLNINFFDSKGKPSGQGSIEEVRGGPKLSRIVFATPDYKATQIVNANGTFRSSGVGEVPPLLDTILEQFVHPMPPAADLAIGTPELRKQTFGKVSLDCILLNQRIIGSMGPQVAPLGLFPTFCLDPGGDTLRAFYTLGEHVILRNASGRFGTRTVATSVTITDGSRDVASAQITMMRAEHPAPADFTAVGGLDPISSEPVTVDEKVLVNGEVDERLPPTEPVAALKRSASGTVVLKALIGRDGHVRSLRVVSTPDVDLAIAALDAARGWIYKPYLVSGKPVEVETELNVRFGRGPGSSRR